MKRWASARSLCPPTLAHLPAHNAPKPQAVRTRFDSRARSRARGKVAQHHAPLRSLDRQGRRLAGSRQGGHRAPGRARFWECGVVETCGRGGGKVRTGETRGGRRGGGRSPELTPIQGPLARQSSSQAPHYDRPDERGW